MKVTPLANSSCGVEISAIDLAKANEGDFLEVGRLLVENLLVVIRGQKLSALDEVRICSAIGIIEQMNDSGLHRCPQDSNGVPIREIQRVTGMKDASGKPLGLFGHDHDLDWHANRPSAEHERKPLIWLYSVFGSRGSRTSWANCAAAYDDLSEDFKSELEGLLGIFGFEPNRYTTFTEFKSHRNKAGIPIVQKIKGTERKGLYFPFLQLFGFKGKSDEYSQEIMTRLRDHVLQDKYIYHHDWADGDIVISEQWLTIHKRWACDVSQRMLHRISFGYDHVLEQGLLSSKKSQSAFATLQL